MLNLVLSLCSVTCETKGVASDHFPISSDQQLEMFDTWKSICVSESRRCSQFSSYPVDLEELKSTVIDSRKLVLAIDLGGSFLKTDVVEIIPTTQGNYVFDIISRAKYIYESVDADKVGIENMLWNEWVASRVREFVDKHCSGGYPALASLTFSYPIDQTSVSSGQVRFVSKNWRFRRDGSLCQDDVVKSLNDSLRRRSLDIEVKSVSNDVISTYMCGCAHGHDNSIAVVMGTGTNAGFTLKRSAGRDLENPSAAQKVYERVLVNSEWASCPVPEDICTEADRATMATKDKLYSGRLMFELLVAGIGFSDIVKNAMKTRDPAFFSDRSDEKAVLREINRVFYADDGCQKNSLSDIDLYNVVSDFKTRSYKMIAPLIVASMVLTDSPHLTIITNGSCLQSEKDRAMLKSEIEAFLSIKGLSHCTCSIEHYDEASLLGSVYLAVISSVSPSNSSKNKPV